jgi:dipicolinate synthase subunit A
MTKEGSAISRIRVAVLGGDSREVYVAEQLSALGYEVALFGAPSRAATERSSCVEHAGSARAAVRGAQWIVCPAPGLGEGDRVYAPHCPVPIILDTALLAASNASAGGLILGRATPAVMAAAQATGVVVVEMKDDRSLAISNATAVAEALVSLLVSKTQRVLPEHRILVLGYGATGAAFTDALLGLACRVHVAARKPAQLARARQRGAIPVPYAERVGAMADFDIVVNTVPSSDAIPAEAFPALRNAVVVDIASPPGGTHHDSARQAGVDLTWARGLAGARAPLTAGDAQLRIIAEAINNTSHGPPRADGQLPAIDRK